MASIVFGKSIVSKNYQTEAKPNLKDRGITVSHRLNRGLAQFLTGIENSTLIYINSISSGTQTGKAINIDSVGYYSYNGEVWVKEENIQADNQEISRFNHLRSNN
jgi:hypothetical protein